MEILEDDALEIVDNIKCIDFLNICTMRRVRKNRRPQMSIYFCDSKFYDNYQLKYFLNKSIKSQKDWNYFSKTTRPNNIPSNPQKIYKDCGWVSLKDWLGH